MWILVLPWALVVLLLVAVILLFKRKWAWGGGVVALVILLDWWGQVLPLNFLIPLTSSTPSTSVKVMTWNIHGGDGDTVRYKKIADSILQEDADVVFLGELFYESAAVMDSLLKERYPHNNYLLRWCNHYFYSKYPLLESSQIECEGGNEVIVVSRFNVNGHNVDIYGCHLSSNNYTPDDQYRDASEISGSRSMWNYMKGISNAAEKRHHECEYITDSITTRKCNNVIVMGDMNDVSGSSALRHLESYGLQDAWWKGGFGYGATIHHPLPYRIDYIMYNDGFKLKSIKKIDADGLSDHDALVAEFYFNNNESSMNDWYTWVFSGIGVAILGWVGAFFYSKRKKTDRNAEIKGDNNVANQNSDNSSISINK